MHLSVFQPTRLGQNATNRLLAGQMIGNYLWGRMEICRNIPDIRTSVQGLRNDGASVGLVPTMGALHAGHIALVADAKSKCDYVVATIFVNPSQFGDAADLESYPRTEEADLQAFCDAGVNAVLIPSVIDIYPEGDETIVETTRLANVLHGAVRPGHFRGVTTVVARLFNICQPTHAFFGEKDYQQLQVLRRMVRDLHFPLEIIGVKTVREADGLAMSSRNLRLTPENRAAAVVLNKALDQAQSLAANHGSIEEIDALIRKTISAEPRADLRGLDITLAATLAPASGPITEKIAIMLSADFGGILLIDQREIDP